MGSNQKLNNEREENVNIFIYGITMAFLVLKKCENGIHDWSMVCTYENFNLKLKVFVFFN